MPAAVLKMELHRSTEVYVLDQGLLFSCKWDLLKKELVLDPSTTHALSFDKALILPVVGQSGGWSIAGELDVVCAVISP